MSNYMTDIMEPGNYTGVRIFNVIVLIVIPTVILYSLWDLASRNKVSVIILLVLYSFCLLISWGISNSINEQEKGTNNRIFRIRNNYSEGNEVPYMQYVNAHGKLKDTKAWKILYDNAIKEYNKRNGKRYPEYRLIRVVATDVGQLKLMYFQPTLDDHSTWEHGYLNLSNNQDVLESILEYFGEEGYQVAKEWLNDNTPYNRSLNKIRKLGITYDERHADILVSIFNKGKDTALEIINNMTDEQYALLEPTFLLIKKYVPVEDEDLSSVVDIEKDLKKLV